MLKQKRSFVELGVGLLIAGVVAKVVFSLGEALVGVLAPIAIFAGIVLIIVGLVSPGRRI